MQFALDHAHNNQTVTMRDFLKDGLEPLSYFFYSIAITLLLLSKRTFKVGVLLIYYLLGSIFITIACYTPSDNLNRVLYNIFFFLTVAVFSLYFILVLESKLKKIIVQIVLLIQFLSFLYVNFIVNKLAGINNYTYGFTYLTIIFYCLLYFEQVLSNVTELNILYQFDFWLIAGYLIYFLSCFFIILFYENVEVNQRALVWSLQNIILFLCSLTTLGGILWIIWGNKSY